MKRWLGLVGALAGVAVFWLTAVSQSPTEWLVISDADSGQGTLRWAIEAANRSRGDDLIRFNSAMTIRPRSGLPPLTDAGTTIEGHSRGSIDRAPRVWLEGSAAGDAAGLEILGARNVIRGLGIAGFERYGIGVVGSDASDALIEGNWIGFRADGGALANRLSGVAVIGGASGARIAANRIGGNSVPQRTGHGVVIGGGGSVDAVVEGNVIGIGADGSALPNDDGVLVVDSASAAIRGNEIGHSAVAGIELRGSRRQSAVDGNWIGIRRDGALAANNVGVFLGPGSSQARIGGSEANVIAGNRVGIAVEQGAREAVIEGNWIGLAPRGGQPSDEQQPEALVRPNRERGVSVIAGAARISVRSNVVAAGDYGIVVADPSTTQVSLSRNVVAGARSGRTKAAIDVRSGAEISIGGDQGFGNHVCGAEYGIRVAQTEAAQVDSNQLGAGAATRVRFDSDERMDWAIRLDDGVVRARVRNNRIVDAARAGISIVGDSSQDNWLFEELSSETSLAANQFERNAIDIDLGADGPSLNDAADVDRGPNGLLNHPLILDHEVEVVGRSNFGTTFRSTISGSATPGSRVHIYESYGRRERPVARSRPADRQGKWSVSISLIPSGRLRALAAAASGATSEFSPSFTPSQRVKLRAGANWFAWTGPTVEVEEGLSAIHGWLHAVWVYRAAEGGWRGWSPLPPQGYRGSLERLITGDVVRLQMGPNPPRDFFVPPGGALSEEIALVRGFNSAAWLGGRVDALDTLAALDAAQPGLIDLVRQWNLERRSWELIWPRLRGAWDPNQWVYPVLWIRASRDGSAGLE